MQVESIEIAKTEGGERIVHLLTEREAWAIKAAMAANRPLLIEGEPGIGKTQLAWAAAKKLNRPLVSLAVDSRTESRDLLWTFDAVQRLAEAQVAAAVLQKFDPSMQDTELSHRISQLEERIKPSKFVRPGPIWWAIDWKTAAAQLASGEQPPEQPSGWSSSSGIVVLIDEIDKADRDLPNGLLEAFGSRQFTPHGWSEPVRASKQTQPSLMIITTNRERTLPTAFLRRCLKLNLNLPPVLGQQGEPLSELDSKAFLSYLTERGKLHFPSAPPVRLLDAAKKIMEYRIAAIRNQEPQKPGLAEYLDLMRAIEYLSPNHDPDDVFRNICEFFRKPGEH